MFAEDEKRRLQKAGYKTVGDHSAVKLCLWTRKSIKTGEKEFCYKEKFYGDIGIRSHRCLQMTPAFPCCTLRCAFCWRDTTKTLSKWHGKADDPRDIIDRSIEAQRKLLSGLGGTDHSVRHLKEAMDPTNVAISLAGEPTFYENLSSLIEEFHRRKMKTFLVTNGTLPERMEKLSELPTQLYVSLCSNSKDMMDKVQKPLIPDAWERLSKTLALFPSLNTRKVVRMTLVKSMNMSGEDRYAKLIEKAEPDFVEVKAGMAVGFSRTQERIRYEDMATHDEIRAFGERLANLLGYNLRNEKRDSRVVLLTKK